ncbi:MAG: hypothetical protein R3247_11465 [Rhodothermales bacterium]|nr:hypothetical protein [Rhodothermales bacterium]
MLSVDLGSLLLWGVFATGLLTLIMTGSQQLGWSRMSLPYLIGSMFTPHRGRSMLIGFALHFAIGIVFAVLYALLFESWGRASWWLGLLLGLVHGLFMLVVGIWALPFFHPRMAGKHHGPTPTRQLEPPGFLALNYGRRTPMISMLAHLVYGTVLGAFYELAAGGA